MSLESLSRIGSIIQLEDLKSYKTRWEQPIKTHLSQLDLQLVTLGAPSGGPVLHMILQLMDS